MGRYAAGEIGQIWVHAGGDPAKALMAEAVSLAESGGTRTARSATTDYGLWQINVINFDGTTGLNAGNWQTPSANARAAIVMSGNGTNWAPWCTAWLHPVGNCGHGFLPVPEAGSPAGVQLAQLGANPAGAPPPTTPLVPLGPGPTAASGRQVYSDVWGQVQDIANGQAAALHRRLVNAAVAASEVG